MWLVYVDGLAPMPMHVERDGANKAHVRLNLLAPVGSRTMGVIDPESQKEGTRIQMGA